MCSLTDLSHPVSSPRFPAHLVFKAFAIFAFAIMVSAKQAKADAAAKAKADAASKAPPPQPAASFSLRRGETIVVFVIFCPLVSYSVL